MVHWGGFRVAFVAAAVLFFVQASAANPVETQKNPTLDVDESGALVIGTVLVWDQMTSTELVLQKKQGEEWMTIAEEWEAVETPSADDEAYNKYRIEAACSPPGAHEFRIAHEDDGGDFFTKTLTCVKSADTGGDGPLDTADSDETSAADTIAPSDKENGADETGVERADDATADCSAAVKSPGNISWLRLMALVFLL